MKPDVLTSISQCSMSQRIVCGCVGGINTMVWKWENYCTEQQLTKKFFILSIRARQKRVGLSLWAMTIESSNQAVMAHNVSSQIWECNRKKVLRGVCTGSLKYICQVQQSPGPGRYFAWKLSLIYFARLGTRQEYPSGLRILKF